jgi:hypothetical protein
MRGERDYTFFNYYRDSSEEPYRLTDKEDSLECHFVLCYEDMNDTWLGKISLRIENDSPYPVTVVINM